MPAFLIEHFDSLMMMISGFGIAAYAILRPTRFRGARIWFVRNVHVLGLIVLVGGFLLFLSESFSVYSWTRLATSDGKASAEFPASATTETATDTFEGVSAQRVTVKCDVPKRDISLRLSWTDAPSKGPALTVEERIENVKFSFRERGFVISSCVAEKLGSFPCYRMIADKDGGKFRLRMRIAITSKSVYHVMAGSSSGFHDDPTIERFINSFAIK
jgi:hypothetical protein